LSIQTYHRMGAVQTWMAGRMTQLIIDCRDVQRGTFLYDSWLGGHKPPIFTYTIDIYLRYIICILPHRGVIGRAYHSYM
jgi:hypothetical protein